MSITYQGGGERLLTTWTPAHRYLKTDVQGEHWYDLWCLKEETNLALLVACEHCQSYQEVLYGGVKDVVA